MTEELNLAPCPFCGSQAVLHDRAGWEIDCSNDECCAHMVLLGPEKDPLVAAWNSRTHQPAESAGMPHEMTPEMMRAVQINSELGAYACANLSGAYDLFREFWHVAMKAAPQSESADPEFSAMVEAGTKAWADVSKASEWVDELRGGAESAGQLTDLPPLPKPVAYVEADDMIRAPEADYFTADQMLDYARAAIERAVTAQADGVVDERAAFEAWLGRPMMNPNHPTHYNGRDIRTAWEAWQFRAALKAAQAPGWKPAHGGRLDAQ